MTPRTILAGALLALAACVSPPQVQSSAVRPAAEAIVTTHDAYVQADVGVGLAPTEATVALAESAALLVQLGLEDAMPHRALAALAAPVLDRYDAYVRTDPELEDWERRYLLRSSSLFRDVAGLSE